jgi:hypothetical protein
MQSAVMSNIIGRYRKNKPHLTLLEGVHLDEGLLKGNLALFNPNYLLFHPAVLLVGI